MPQCWSCAEHPQATQAKDGQTLLSLEAAHHILVAARCKAPRYLLWIRVELFPCLGPDMSLLSYSFAKSIHITSGKKYLNGREIPRTQQMGRKESAVCSSLNTQETWRALPMAEVESKEAAVKTAAAP